MLLELTNRCNNACIFCKHKEMKSPIGDMSLDLSGRFLEEAYDMGVRTVGMHATGEFFLCKNFAKHIKKAKSIGFNYVYADTNGLLATKENLEIAIKAGLDSIKFSVDAGTNKTHALMHYGGEIRCGDTFDKVINNIKFCFELRERLNKKMKIFVGYALTKQNENELEILKKIVEPYITEPVSVNPLGIYNLGDYSPFKNFDEYCLEMIPSGHRLHKKVPCKNIFEYRIIITHDGYLTACCIDFDRELLIADLKKCSLKEAWVSERAIEIKEKHLEKNVKGLVCDNCFHCVSER